MGIGHSLALNYSVVLKKQTHVVLPSHRQSSAMIIPWVFFLMWVFGMELLAICDPEKRPYVFVVVVWFF